MSDQFVHIARVDTKAGFVLLQDDSICEITNMFDDEGDELDLVEPEAQPARIVFQLPNEKWASVNLAFISDRTIH